MLTKHRNSRPRAKRFCDLKQSQQERIDKWLYVSFAQVNKLFFNSINERERKDETVARVMPKIVAAQIHIGEHEITKRYEQRILRMRKRYAREPKGDTYTMVERMQTLIAELNRASEAYYGGKDEIMSNYEWDTKFDELAKLEAESGIILPGSPTQNVSGAEEQENTSGQKEPHEYPALSLAKTKKVEDLQEWAGDRPIWLSWKLDGLTLVLTYDDGKLTKILTRGNGSIGTNITYMQNAIAGFPQKIDYFGHLVVRGEALISYDDFESINSTISNPDERYANPRNLASGTLALDPSRLDEVKARHVTFIAFTLVHIDVPMSAWGVRMSFLKSLGFNVVDHERTNASMLPAVVEKWTEKVEKGHMRLPVDGLVICYEDTDYANTGSVTGHHAMRAGLAFKWQDEVAVSTLREIEWSCGATTITPVAIFDPVLLEGTTVSRASLVNISEMERLGIGENGKTSIEVIKANKIIPKVVGVTKSEGRFTLPEACPVCGNPTQIIVGASGSKTLRCNNPDCAAKNLKKFERFVGKTGLDINGLSAETLRDFIAAGMIHNFADIFRLWQHATEIRVMPGYGPRSCDNLLRAIDKARDRVDPVCFLTALCIPQIGPDAAKRIVAAFGWPGCINAVDSSVSFSAVQGIGEERASAISEWFADANNRAVFDDLLTILDIKTVASAPVTGICDGLTFVITGEVNIFKNRDAFKAYVESHGGKVAGSVSKKTSFLVNNDSASMSSKNQKAKELGIPIITENEFVAQFGTSVLWESQN